MTENVPKTKRRLQIEDGLRQVYDTYSSTEVPDRFASLLEQLERDEGGGARHEGSGVEDAGDDATGSGGGRSSGNGDQAS